MNRFTSSSELIHLNDYSGDGMTEAEENALLAFIQSWDSQIISADYVDYLLEMDEVIDVKCLEVAHYEKH